MRKHRVLMLLLVTSFLVASCGGGSKGSKATGPTTAPAPAPGGPTSTAPAPAPGGPTSTAPAGSDPAKAAKAQAATLQPTDFPPGFEPQPEEPGQGLGIEALWGDLTRCLGVENTAQPATIATSPTFKQGLATQARSTVEYTTESSAGAIDSALAGPKSQGCLTEAFNADLNRSKPEGSTAGPVEVAPRDVAPVGQKAMAWRVSATVMLGELPIKLFQDFLVITNGGTVIRMFFLNPGSEFPPVLERTLVEKVVGRA